MTFRMATLALVAVVGAACVGASGASRPLVAIPGKVFVMPSLARDAAGSARTSKPRNGLIVYGSERAVNHVYWLYVMAPNGAQQRSLAGVRGVSAPAVSPDSRWLVFAKDAIRCWPGGAALYLMRADGTHLRRLTHERRCYGHPSWAPDGRRIAYASWTQSTFPTIWVMSRTGTGRHRLTSAGANGTDQPAWSPDGQTIAFRAGAPPGTIWLMDADGRNRRQLTTPRADRDGDGDPSWSPDGRWIAFDRAHSLSDVWYTDIYVIRGNGSGLRQLTDRLGHLNAMPDWSPDGTRIVFVSDRRRRNGMRDIYVMNADGAHQTRLTRSGLDNQWPTWQTRR